ncbi:MAG: hypothetical protein JSS38_08550 [Nitrospira sp.]|nr:hypothetical protein [Nitrospira sp.]
MGHRWKSQHVRLTYTFINAHRREFDTAHDVPPPRRLAERVLSMGTEPALQASGEGPAAAWPDPLSLSGEPRHLRRPVDRSRFA